MSTFIDVSPPSVLRVLRFWKYTKRHLTGFISHRSVSATDNRFIDTSLWQTTWKTLLQVYHCGRRPVKILLQCHKCFLGRSLEDHVKLAGKPRRSVTTTEMCRIDFLCQFGFWKKTQIRFKMSLVWFKKHGLVRILQLLTNHVITEQLIYSKYYRVTAVLWLTSLTTTTTSK